MYEPVLHKGSCVGIFADLFYLDKTVPGFVFIDDLAIGSWSQRKFLAGDLCPLRARHPHRHHRDKNSTPCVQGPEPWPVEYRHQKEHCADCPDNCYRSHRRDKVESRQESARDAAGGAPCINVTDSPPGRQTAVQRHLGNNGTNGSQQSRRNQEYQGHMAENTNRPTELPHPPPPAGQVVQHNNLHAGNRGRSKQHGKNLAGRISVGNSPAHIVAQCYARQHNTYYRRPRIQGRPQISRNKPARNQFKHHYAGA